MKPLYISFLFLAMLLSIALQAQQVTGTVTNEKGEPLFGATLLWDNTRIGTVTNEAGYFEIPAQPDTSLLLIRYVGYEPVYIEVYPDERELLIEIDGVLSLDAVEISARQRDQFFNVLNPINSETIGKGELRKAACCSLAESFETNASVDVVYNDAVTGAKEVQMLGLRGTYTELLNEKKPGMAGLGVPYVMEYYPGTWLESIQISKGVGSVQNGYGGMAGQINFELAKPWEDDPFFLNLFAGVAGRGEVNMHLNHELNEKVSTGLLLHASALRNEWDHNHDGFYDVPQKSQLNGMYRLFFRGPIIQTQFNIQVIRDIREGGQIVPEGRNPLDFYQIRQLNERVNVSGKFAYLGFNDPNSSLALIVDASTHKLDAFYGRRPHSGTQQYAHANLLYAGTIGSNWHRYNVGATLRYNNILETFNETSFDRMEQVPGVYAEYAYGASCESEQVAGGGIGNKFGVVAGARVDQHNLYGTLFTPRLHLKYNFSNETVLRFSAGRGYRMADIISENVSLLVSSRAVEVIGELDVEEAWTAGFNFGHKFFLFNEDASFSMDFYRTEFTRQIVVDLEQDFSRILFYNLDGRSFSNSFLAQLAFDPIKRLSVRLAYKFNDVRVTFGNELLQRPLTARNHGLITLDYETPGNKWMFNLSTQITGTQRLPDNSQIPAELLRDHPEQTPAYTIFNAQITRRFTRLEFYLGGENLSHVRQPHPIIAYQDPFGPYFNAAQVYAPIMGIMGYVGMRFWLE